MKYSVFITLLLIWKCSTENKNSTDLIITNVNIIDVVAGTIIENQDVRIRDSIIISISNNNNKSKIFKNKLDGKGKFLLPGLWDMHVHIQDQSYLKLFLDYGVLGVRDMGGCVSIPTNGCESLCPDILNKWKSKINKNKQIGPELYISGQILSGTGWPTSLRASSIEDVQHNFAIILNSKVDFIKVYEQIPADAYREISRLCKKNNIDFAGHVSESLLLSEISDLGQKSIEHIREQILFCFTKDTNELEAFLTNDSYTKEDRIYVKPWINDAEQAIHAFKKNNTWFVPTMSIQFSRQRYNDSMWITNSLRSQLPQSVQQSFDDYIIRMKNNPDKKSDLLWWSALEKLVKRLNDEGVGLLAGTDIACEGGIPGFSLHEELKLMVEQAGLTPIEALRTATINPAQYFGLLKNGQIKENFIADLILIEKNPLESISNTMTINTVIRNGVIYRK